MKNYIILTVLLALLSTSTQAQTKGQIFWAGQENSLLEIKQNIVFDYLSNTQTSLNEFEIWCLSKQTDKILNDGGIRFNFGDKTSIDSLLEKSQKYPLFNTDIKIRGILREKYSNQNIYIIDYEIIDSTFVNNQIEKEIRKIKEISNFRFFVLTVLNKDNIYTNSFNSELIKDVLISNTGLVKNIFSKKGMNVIADNKFSSELCDMSYYQNPLLDKAFYSGADYLTLIKILNISEKSNGLEHSFNAEFIIEIVDLATGGYMASKSYKLKDIPVQNEYEIETNIYEYVLNDFAADNFIYNDNDNDNSNSNFLNLFYNQLYHNSFNYGNDFVFDYNILIEKSDNVDAQTIRGIIEILSKTHSFMTEDISTYNNFINVKLVDCQFNKYSFKRDLINELGKDYIICAKTPPRFLKIVLNK